VVRPTLLHVDAAAGGFPEARLPDEGATAARWDGDVAALDQRDSSLPEPPDSLE
jgi:hypothetical protein